MMKVGHSLRQGGIKLLILITNHPKAVSTDDPTTYGAPLACHEMPVG
jgi:hypothetical protein